jgi:Domain of unknown function (DUF4389)
VAAVATALVVCPSRVVAIRESLAYNSGMASFDDTRPTRLRGDYDQSVSRWLWLVKWLLLIPHFIVLIFLHIARFVVTIIAFFAILFTGRYPRALFDFSVGVLRWSWRVRFYGYGALGTDKYPPFTLRSTDYPADLEVDYPERLSRGLVLIKWWLLAIPHYLILMAIVGGAVFAGAGGYHRMHHYHHHYHHGPATISLFAVLLLILFVALLFTGRYPRGIFDLLLGFNRWFYRVRVYATLLRDEYPPFRLDQGPTEPVAPPGPVPTPRTDTGGNG